MRLKRIFVAVLAMVVLALSMSVSATASTDTGESTYTDGIIPSVTKMTTDEYAEFQGGYMTSWTKPTARLVNSKKEGRSGWVTLKTDSIYSTTSVTATKNYYCYAEIKGAWNQTGTDTMRFRYNPY